MPSSFRTRRPHVLATLAFLTIFMQALSTGARAEIQITGESDATKVEAKEASLEDLLIALNKAFGLQYRSSANPSRSVSGTFAGTLQQVVSRVFLLEGYNFIAETSVNSTMVAVYEASTAPGSGANPQPMAAAMPRPKPPPHPPEAPQRLWRGLPHGGPMNNRQMIQFLQHHGQPE